MKVLHICTNWPSVTKTPCVFEKLCEAEDKQGLEQLYYSSATEYDKTVFKGTNAKIIYSNILNLYTRINFFCKKQKIYCDLLHKMENIRHVDFVHAHSWYSDGAVAYQLYKDYDIPYIVTIRNTDWNVYYKYLIHTRRLGLKILLNAKQIIFISEIYRKKFLQSAICRKNKELIAKCKVIPNGIDSFWICNIQKRKVLLDNPNTILYIGNFSKTKNLKRLIAAIESLITDGYKLTFHIIGGGWDNGKTEQFIKTKNFIVYHGKIFDKNELVKIMRKADIFAMPSIHETFGLVYIEALSQGLPVIYTKGEGIDGFYGKEIGEAVNARNTEDIEIGIKKIIDHYNDYNFIPEDIAKNHDWDKIAERYLEIYNYYITTH